MLLTLATLLLLTIIATFLYQIKGKLSESNDVQMVFTGLFADARQLQKKLDEVRKKKKGEAVPEKPVRKPRNNSGSDLYQ